MTDVIFDRLWHDSHSLFGLLAPKDGRKTICREKTKHIPDEAAKWIAGQFDDMDSKPRNMAKTINFLWQRWQEENPTRIRRDPHHCKFCIPNTPGRMLVLRRQAETGKWFQFVVPCGHCQLEGWRIDGSGHGIFWHHCPGGVIPKELEYTLKQGTD